MPLICPGPTPMLLLIRRLSSSDPIRSFGWLLSLLVTYLAVLGSPSVRDSSPLHFPDWSCAQNCQAAVILCCPRAPFLLVSYTSHHVRSWTPFGHSLLGFTLQLKISPPALQVLQLLETACPFSCLLACPLKPTKWPSSCELQELLSGRSSAIAIFCSLSLCLLSSVPTLLSHIDRFLPHIPLPVCFNRFLNQLPTPIISLFNGHIK